MEKCNLEGCDNPHYHGDKRIEDSKVFADVILLTLLEIMGVERFRLALVSALSRHKSDSHLRTERKNAEEFSNVLNDLEYPRWQREDFKM